MTRVSSRASLELLFNISRDLANNLDLGMTLSRVLLLSTQNVGAERGSLIVLDERQNVIDAAIVYRDKLLPYTAQQARDILNQGLAGWVVWNREPALVVNTSQDVRWMIRPDDAADRSGVKSAICVPLTARDRLVGVLTVVHPKAGALNQNHFQLLKAIADLAGIAVYNSLLYETLETAHRRYRELFEDSIDPIIVTNLQGSIIEANRRAAETMQMTLDDLLKHTIFDLHKVNMEILQRHLDGCEENQTSSYESCFLHEGVESIPIEVHVRKVIIENENYLQWILRDISERKNLDTMRQDLSAMIYHDLRSPLSNVTTSLEVMESMLPTDGDPNLRIIFSVISRSAARIQRLVNSLLDISRLEANQPITNKAKMVVADLVSEVAAIVHPTIESRSQKLEERTQNPLPDLIVDTDMIRRVLINLLENASKFSPTGGLLVLGAERKENFIQFWVKDSGPGIPVKAQQMIFDKFTRLQSENSPKGVGLGLAFCRLAVEAHGGRIWVESSGGNGSLFAFTLPVTEEA